jgi:hypothetical protein
MKRMLVFSVVVLVASLFIGTALKVQAATPSAPTAALAAAPAADASAPGYWTAWAEAASH